MAAEGAEVMRRSRVRTPPGAKDIFLSSILPCFKCMHLKCRFVFQHMHKEIACYFFMYALKIALSPDSYRVTWSI